MRALQVSDFATPPRLDDIAMPDPGDGQVLIRIAACGLNFADMLMARGTYQDTPPLPFTLGMELAGTVARLGDGVTGLSVGQRVAVNAGHGGLAEAGVFPAAAAQPIPDAMPFEDAAAFMVAYGTSHLGLVRRARLKRGERMVVLGAAGGVGLTAVEVGAALGAEIVAVARGAAKLEIAQAAGAHHLIDSGTEGDLRDRLKALGGVDVIYDAVGGALTEQALRAARPEGRLLVVGFASGDFPTLRANHLMVKNVDVVGFYWGGYKGFAPEVLSDSLAEVMDWYTAGKLRPHISRTFPLAQADEALEFLRSRKSTGKVVVTM
ncbi:NADPH:quinone oxidoreductase family protein [Palleronia abyssalis]|uniref:2-haloacrylate reductase n=1 Tax=Palleronia abyssalis TaxID=1501240 RepID=A0A2R8BUN1_9RHOB|nr:NADPH:quinone oxidoreductase family protein [Palleronia abyssalis]SPJ23835.1 2-haloacrylate reductase [Palleronia abyssalis]